MRPASDDERAIDCPVCAAAAGDPCETPSGEVRSAPHVRRVKAAERNRQEAARAVEEARKRAEASAPSRIRSKRFQRLYIACRLELEQRGAWTILADEEVESLVLNMELAAAARAKIAGNLVVKGSTGQAVPNPLIATALKFDAQALITARSLKLTPDTRGTSAPTPDELDVDAAAGDDDVDRPEIERDELAKLDELARKRKAKAG